MQIIRYLSLMYYRQDANMYEKVTSVISWNCPTDTVSGQVSDQVIRYKCLNISQHF